VLNSQHVLHPPETWCILKTVAFLFLWLIDAGAQIFPNQNARILLQFAAARKAISSFLPCMNIHTVQGSVQTLRSPCSITLLSF
jgi:hypothetical protein